MDVNCYANSKLFICKNACYKRLLKFQRALEKLEEIKREINEAFRVRPRAKRLLRPADEDLEQDRAPLTASESASGLSSTNRAKASKSLQFSSTKDISTTCVSSTNSKQPLPASVRPLAYFPEVSSPIQSVENQNYRLVSNAFPNTHLGSSQEFRPSLTSTPTSTREQNVNQVKLSVQYSSKPLNKKLSGAYQTIGKALAHGVPSRIAGAIMNCQPVRKQIVEKVMKIVSKEVTGLCSKTNPSVF